MNQRKKIVNKILDQAKKLGLNMDKVTEGKSIDTLSRSAKTIENLKKRFKRQKEQPKIQSEVRKIDRRLANKKYQMEQDRIIEERRKIKRGIITDKSKAHIKWEDEPKEINTNILEKKTSDAINDFFTRYFKEIKHENEFQKTLERIKKRFGVRLDLAYDYMRYLGELAYKYEIPRELMKSDTPQDFVSMMRDRLDNFENIIGREYDL